MPDINWADFKPAPDQDVSNLVSAITHVESGGDAGAVSTQGATGSMQIMPATFRQYARPGEDFSRDSDRRNAAVRKIVDDYVHFGGDLNKTAAAYIGGRGAVRPDGTIRDDVADANGTTPATYAQMVAGRIANRPKVDWSQFTPVHDPDAGSGRGFVNPPDADPSAPLAQPAGSVYTPPDQDVDPMGSGGPEIMQALQQRGDAGAGRGFVNPPDAAQPQSVGLLESIGRGFGRAGAETARLPSLVASAAGVAWDKLASAVTGTEQTGAQDWMFRNLVDPRQEAVDWYALGPDQKQTFLGKIGDSIGAMAQDLPLMIASGGAKQRMEIAQQFPTMARYLENAFSSGYDAMRPIMVKSGLEKAKQVLDSGGTTAQAMTSATTAAMWTGLSGGQPMSAEGTLLQRMATGVPAGMAQEEAGRVVQNAADPTGMQRPFDPAEMLAGGATNAIAAGAMGHAEPGRAPDRIDLGYDPLTGKTPVADAVQGIGAQVPRLEPGQAQPAARDHIADIFNAGSVEDAAQSALNVAMEPVTQKSVADEIRAIRPAKPVLNESNTDVGAASEVPGVPAGAGRSGSADAGAGVDLRMGDDGSAARAVDTAGMVRKAAAEPVRVGDERGTEAVAPELQSARTLIDAVDSGGIPLNPAKLRSVAEGLGLEVRSDAKPEDTIARIRAAVDRAETVTADEATEEDLPAFTRSEQGPVDSGNTEQGVRSELRARFGSSLDQLENAGILKIWNSASDYNAASGQSPRLPSEASGAAQGMYVHGVAHLFVDGINPGNAVGVMLHEVGEHASMRNMLGNDRYADLVRRAYQLAHEGDPSARNALDRIPGNTPRKSVDSEMLAYTIEEAANRPQSTAIRQWLVDAISAMRAWFYRTPFAKQLEQRGIRLNLTPNDIVALAVRAVHWQAAQHVNGNKTGETNGVGRGAGTSNGAVRGPIREPGSGSARADVRDLRAGPDASAAVAGAERWQADSGLDRVRGGSVREGSADAGSGGSASEALTRPQFSRKDERPFYSALTRGVASLSAKAQGADGWRAQIDGMVNKGQAKRDEVEWSGVNEWLRAQTGKVSKQQVLDYLAHNGVQVHEVMRGGLDEESQRDIDFHNQNVRFAEQKLDRAIDEASGHIEKAGANQVQLANSSTALRHDNPGEGSDSLEMAYRLLQKGAPEGYDLNTVNDARDELQSAIHHRDQAASRARPSTKYGDYTLPGGTNYRELLLTLPRKELPSTFTIRNRDTGGMVGDFPTRAEADEFMRNGPRADEFAEGHFEVSEERGGLERGYRGGHWDEPNILAHVRLNDRTDADGRRTLFVEELQSDWAQDARKRGFRENYRPEDVQPMPAAEAAERDPAHFWYFTTPDNTFQIPKSKYPNESDARDYIVREKPKNSTGLSRAPFVDSTDKWLPLALKRIIKMAADEGYDRVAFVNGKQSAERYDLSKQIGELRYHPESEHLRAYKERGDRDPVIDRQVSSDELPDVVGKEMADRLLNNPTEVDSNGVNHLRGLDLKVGGEGMRTFYDNIVPAAVNKLLPRLGGERMGTVQVDRTTFGKNGRPADWNPRDGAFSEQPGFDVTPKMRGAVADGVPMFSRKGTTAATDGMPASAPSTRWERSKSVVSDLIDEGLSRSGIYKFTSPMSEGSVRARAIAQNFANSERLARAQWDRIATLIQDKFTTEQRRQMWEAADEQNTLLQKGDATSGRGLERLSPQQRDVVEQLHTYGEELLRRAKNAGMFEGEGLPYWTPRMMVMLDEHGEYVRPPSGEPGKQQTSDGEGRNVFTSSSNLKQRKYLTAEETEAAMQAKGGELVRDIMTMPLAMQRLERAIAGRELINQVKELGKATGEPTVQTGRPDHEGWFTLDHAAFTTYRPRFEQDPVTGKTVALKDANGNIVFDRVPLYMSKEFEGPIRSILSNNDGALYRAYMLLKSKAMSAIMFSPLIHNMVIFGRALGYDPTMAGTVALYFKGHAARADNELFRTALEGGMVPMGYHRQGMVDITDVARGFGKEGGWLDPHESWVAHGAKAIIGSVNKDAGAAAKRFVDKAGDFWHGTLLWNRVADLQMGIFSHAYERLTGEGFEPGIAKVLAAHWANRYAGAVARENMSEIARKAANVLLFSRSFNMGNLGTVKDLAYGMPSGMRAKIEAEYGRAGASQAFTEARRKAWVGFVADAAMSLIALSVAQSAVDRLKKGKGWDEIFGGYTDRAQRMWENIKAHPANPTSYSPWQLSPTHDNEPGKQDRVDMGEIPDQGGRHEYMRLPTGKVVEDTINWITHFGDTFASKMSPLAKSVAQMFANDKGYGVPVYDPNGTVNQGALDIAKHLARAETPWDTIVTAWDKMHGKTTAIENDKLVGNMTGFSYSQGHPQGPEAGVAAEVEQRVQAQKMMAMEDVKRLLRYDKEDEARQKLEDIGLAPREITQILRRIEQPKDGMTRNQVRKFNQHGTEEDQRRMEGVTR
jgi:hypothetical protein